MSEKRNGFFCTRCQFYNTELDTCLKEHCTSEVNESACCNDYLIREDLIMFGG